MSGSRDWRLEKRRAVKLIVKYLAVAVVMVFWAAYVWHNWESFASISWEVNPEYSFAAFALYVGFYLVMGTGWVLTLRGMAANVSFVAAFRVWIVSMPARYLPGTGWHIAGRAYMGSGIGIGIKDLLVSTYVEHALAVISGGLVFVISAILSGIVLEQVNWYLTILIPAGIALTHSRVLQTLLNLASRVLKKDSIELGLGFSRVLALLVWFAFSHVLSGVSLFLVLASISPTPLRLLPSIVGASALAWVIGLLSILTPGGIGVREATIVVLGSPVVAAPVLSAAAFTVRFLSALAEVFLVAASTVVSHRAQPHPRGDHT